MDNKINLPEASATINVEKTYTIAADNGIPNELTLDTLKQLHLLPLVESLSENITTEVMYPKNNDDVEVNMSASFVVLDKATFDAMITKFYATE